MRWKNMIWPAGVVAALAVTVAANGVMLWAASGRHAAAIEPDYYRKAVEWDSTLALRRHSAELGWTLDAVLERPGAGGADLRVSLEDAAGLPLSGAEVRVTAFHNAEAARPIEATLTTRVDGTAVRRMPFDRAGRWELRFDVHRGAEHFAVTLRRERTASIREPRP